MRTPDELRALAAVLVDIAPGLRAAGVLEIGDVKLAPVGVKQERIELTEDEIYEREMRLAQMRRDIQFAASSIKPILRHQPRSPDSVVQRAASARGRGSGQQTE